MAANGTHAVASGPVEAKQTALPGARLALALLLTINLFNYIDRYVLAAVLTPIQDAFFVQEGPEKGQLVNQADRDIVDRYLRPVLKLATGKSAATPKTLLGLLTTAFLVSYMVLAPVFGLLAERWRRWWLVAVGVVLWSLASGASGLAATFVILLVTRCFVGVGEAAYGPVAPTMISDLYPIRVRGQVLAWFYAAIPVGSALGYAWGGLVAGSLDWHWAFYLVLPPGLLLGVWCLLMPEPRRGQADLAPSASKHRASLKDYGVLLRTPSYVLNTLGMAAMTFAIGGIAVWMPDYILDFRGQRHDDSDIARVNMIFGGIVVVAGLTATLLGGYVGDRLRGRFPGSYFLVSGVAMLVAFPFFLATLWAPFPLAWACIFVTCFFLFFNTGPTNTILANVTHPAIRATGFAVNIFVIHLLGDAISPPVIGAIADATAVDGKANMNAGFLAVSGMILLGGAFWLWGTRYLKADTDRAPHSLPERAAP
jgi:MFS family permease